jgi:hypothetical protein
VFRRKSFRGPGLGAGVNPAGAGNGGGAAEFDDYCPAPNKEKSQESSTHHQDFTQKKKKEKKKRNLNQHLNRQIEVNGETFEFEWDQIEKKAPSHGPDFGLDPDYGPDGKIIRDRKTGKPGRNKTKKIMKNSPIIFQNLSKIQSLKELNLNIVKDGRMNKMQLVS